MSPDLNVPTAGALEATTSYGGYHSYGDSWPVSAPMSVPNELSTNAYTALSWFHFPHENKMGRGGTDQWSKDGDPLVVQDRMLGLNNVFDITIDSSMDSSLQMINVLSPSLPNRSDNEQQQQL